MVSAIRSFFMLLSSPVIISATSIDFSRLSDLQVLGSFDGISLFNPSAVPLPFDSNTSQLYIFNPEADSARWNRLVVTEKGGDILTACAQSDDVYFAGQFQSANGVPVKNVAVYSKKSHQISPLATGIDGRVHAVHCSDTEIVFGGDIPGGVTMWNIADREFHSAGFGSLDGIVKKITPSSTGGLIYSGNFTYAISTNQTIDDTFNVGTNVSRALSYPAIPLLTAELTAGPASEASANTNPDVLLCPGGPGYAFADGSSAKVTVRFFQATQSIGIRLANTPSFSGLYKTSTFSISSIPDNVILSLKQPSGLQCSDSCLLSDSADTTDFIFANGAVLLTGFQINILSFTGSGAGLGLVQLLGQGASAYADPQLNAISCDSYPYKSSVTQTGGTWTTSEGVSTIPGTVYNYISSSSPDAELEFHVYVPVPGNYDILFDWPACPSLCTPNAKLEVFMGEETSSVASISVDESSGPDTVSLYTGSIAQGLSSLRIKLSFGSDSFPGHLLLANAVQLVLLDDLGAQIRKNNTTGASILEYKSDSQQNMTSRLNQSSINAVGYKLYMAGGGDVNAVVQINDVFYIGGSFHNLNITGGTFLISYSAAEQKISSVGGGLNGLVHDMLVVDEKLYVIGNFTQAGNGPASYVAMWDGEVWSTLGSGFSSQVFSISHVQNHLIFAGGSINLNNNSPSSVSVWDLSVNDWALPQPYSSGQAKFLVNCSSSELLVVGMMSAVQDFTSSGIVSFSSSAAEAPQVSTFGNSTHDTSKFPNQNSEFQAFYSVVRYSNKTSQYIIYGGEFALSGSSSNLIVYDSRINSSVYNSGVGSIVTMQIQNDLLFAGGNFSLNDSVQNFGIYDLQKGIWKENTSSSSGGVIQKIVHQSHDGNLIIAGGFSSISSANCSNICVYSIAEEKFSSLGPGLTGDVQDILLLGDSLYAGGSFSSFLARWDTSSGSWNYLQDVPGPVVSLSSFSNTIFVAGSNYLGYINKDQYIELPKSSELEGDSIFRAISVVPIDEKSQLDVLKQNHAILVSGNLILDNSPVQAALYNGNWTPLISTSRTGRSSGSVYGLSNINNSQSSFGNSHLSDVVVVLISLAIALGFVFLFFIIIFLINIRRNKSEGMNSKIQRFDSNGQNNLNEKPSDLLQHITEATALVASGGGSRNSAAASSLPATLEGRTVYARYSFDGANPGELRTSTGEGLKVLDETDKDWWLVANGDGVEGIVPATFLF